MNLAELYASCDPAGYDACRLSGREFDGGSFSRPSNGNPDFEIALCVLAGEPVSIVEATSAVDLVDRAVRHLADQYEGDLNSTPRYGPLNYLRGASARLNQARNKRRKTA